MANFDEDIKRITDEILSDGTVDRIIREKVTDGIEKAIASSFSYGKLEKAVKERVEQVLVPFIENYNMSAYIVKLDTVLTEIVNKSVLMDNKQMLENFQYLMKEPQITEMKLTDLFKEYKKFVARNMDTYGRKVEWDESPEYEAMTAFFEFEEDRERIWSSFKYATIDFTVDEEKQQEELNRTIRLSKWDGDRKDGWEIRVDTNPNLNSLRNLDEFDLLLLKLQRADVRIIADELGDEDYVYSDTKPEPTYALVKRLKPAIDRMMQTLQIGAKKGIGMVKNVIDKLGGVDNALKLLAIIAGAFFIVMNWSKMISGAKAFITLLTKMKGLFSLANLKTLAIVAAVVLLALIVEDFINFLMGNDSVIGTIFDKAGIGADNAREAIFKAWQKVKEFLLNVWDFLKQAAGMWVDTVKGFFERHGESIKENFMRAWGIIKTFLSGVWTFISQLAATIFGGTEDSIDGSTTSTKDT